jgi:hypothetical protein
MYEQQGNDDAESLFLPLQQQKTLRCSDATSSVDDVVVVGMCIKWSTERQSQYATTSYIRYRLLVSTSLLSERFQIFALSVSETPRRDE